MTVASGPPIPSSCQIIIADAMFNAGLLAQGDEPNSEELVVGMRRLNKFINYLQTRGLKLWVQEDVPVNLNVGQGLYSFGPTGTNVMVKPRRVIEAYYSDNNQNRRPLPMLSRNEWDTLSTISTQGTVTNYFVDKQQVNLNVNLWLIPDVTAASGTLHLIMDQQIANFVQVTDTMAFPVEWELTLEWGLSSQLASGQPQAIMDRCAMMAEKYLMELEDWDVEDASTVFQPDQRGQYVGRRMTR